MKDNFEKRFGEGTAFDLDYGKLLIIALCIYIAAGFLMPEGPECTRTARQVNRAVQGKELVNLNFISGRYTKATR